MNAASGIRAAFILAVLGTYWVMTAWPSGATMTLIAAATVGLSAATPNPKRMAFQMACGTFIGALVGFVEMFFVLPRIDGFPLLCLVLAPVIIFGSFLTSRAKYAGVGLGLLIFFSTGVNTRHNSGKPSIWGSTKNISTKPINAPRNVPQAI